jgi:hypothetical protein
MPQAKLDEGFTELFARLIVYRIQQGVANGTISMDAREVPQLVTHDYIGIDLSLFASFIFF